MRSLISAHLAVERNAVLGITAKFAVLPCDATRGGRPGTKELPQEDHLPNVITCMRADDVQHLQATPLSALGQEVPLK
jgi:hypothetical protein